MAHKHSKVANYLEEPGKFSSKNAQRIRKEANDKIDDISEKYGVDIDIIKRELKKEKMNPEKLVDAAKELKEIVTSEMNSRDEKVTITISKTLAKLLVFILNIAIFFVVTFIGFASLFLSLGSAAAGITNTGTEKLWDWIFSGKWMVGHSSTNNNNTMKYTNNPMKN